MHELLTEEKYRRCIEEFGDRFKSSMGAEAIKELLKQLDLEKLSSDLREEMKTTTSAQQQKKVAKRLRVVEAFLHSGNKPDG
jgi:DNA-directed RNA polymerase subunit beta'